MDGIHDLGGRQGYGPIDVHEPEEPFHAAWEGRLLGMVRSMSRTAPWSIDWFRHVRELIDPADYLTRPYYDQWLQTYAAMMVDSGVATVEELASGKSERGIPGLAPPMAPAAVPGAKNAMARFDGAPTSPPRFTTGDTVRTKRDGAPGHTRLPQYARDRIGRIVAHHGAHMLPDSNLHNAGHVEALYTVAFTAEELWPEAAGRPDSVRLDLWESYLEPA